MPCCCAIVHGTCQLQRPDGLTSVCWQVATLLLVPICPHTCEHIWSNLLKKEGFVINGAHYVALNPGSWLCLVSDWLAML